MFRYFRARAAVLVLAGWTWLPVQALPPLTQIQDVVYNANGRPFQGTLTVQWKAFQASDGTTVAANQVTLPLVNGVLNLRLVPTTTAAAGAFYSVRYQTDGRSQFSELWTVPPSAANLRVKDIRIAAAPNTSEPPPPVTVVQITDVAGLQEALAERIVRGPTFGPGRTAVIDAQGALIAASGGLSDCVRVDGTSGPCGTGGGATPGFVDQETLAGLLDGENRVFTVAAAPAPTGSLHVYRNGVLQRTGVDYTLAGNSVTFLAVSTPQAGDLLVASYRIAP
jgi:hypothetical protein